MIYFVNARNKYLVVDQNLQPMEPFADYRHEGVKYLAKNAKLPIAVQFDIIQDPPDDEEHNIGHILEHIGPYRVSWFNFEPVNILPKDSKDTERTYLGRMHDKYCNEYEFINSLGIHFRQYVPNQGLENYFDNMFYLDAYLWYESSNLANQSVETTKDFEYSFFCPNYKDKIHRRVLAAHLYANYKDTSIITYHFKDQDYSNKWAALELDEFQNKLLEHRIPLFPNNVELQAHDMPDMYKNSFCTIVTETFFDDRFANFSEKTLDPIMYARPFVLAAPPLTLKLLKDLGFKTFDKWWDESYDREYDHRKRLKKLKNVIDIIANMSYNTKKVILDDMQEVLQHNREQIKKLEEVFHDIYRK